MMSVMNGQAQLLKRVWTEIVLQYMASANKSVVHLAL